MLQCFGMCTITRAHHAHSVYIHASVYSNEQAATFCNSVCAVFAVSFSKYLFLSMLLSVFFRWNTTHLITILTLIYPILSYMHLHIDPHIPLFHFRWAFYKNVRDAPLREPVDDDNVSPSTRTCIGLLAHVSLKWLTLENARSRCHSSTL